MMKRLLLCLASLLCYVSLWSDNFVLTQGQSSKFFAPHGSSLPLVERADRLFAQDYHEVFAGDLIHTNYIEDARIIACTYDNAALRKYAKLRGISFAQLAGKKDAFILKVHNNGSQLFVVGSDDRGTAFGLMTLSRMWGVSPFRWWTDTPALPRDRFELGVVYESLMQATVSERVLVLENARQQDEYLQDILLRLRATGISSITEPDDGQTFCWNLDASRQPYLGLSLALDHPERIRVEGLRAYDNGCRNRWLLRWEPQMGGELQMFLFFDMAWDIDAYRQPFAVDRLEDLHFSQMTGLSSTWSQLWNDYYDLVVNFHPEKTMSIESLRRGIGESQSLALQLSLEMNDKAIRPAYNSAFFRTVEYPLNILTAQMQRLCNMQLVQHGIGTNWAIEDCTQRMEILTRSIPEHVHPKWNQILRTMELPTPAMGQSLMQQQDGELLPLVIGSNEPLLVDDTKVLLYRSSRAFGTQVKPFEPLELPLNHQTDRLDLLMSFLPLRSYGKALTCIVTVDNGEPQLVVIDPKQLGESQQQVRLVFDIDSTAERHRITFRTTSDGIYLQRVWLSQPE